MVAPLIIGGMLGAMGGLMQGSAQQRAAEEAAKGARFRPLALGGAGGQVSYLGDKGTAARVSPDQLNQLFMNAFGQQALNNLSGGGYGQGAINFGNLLGQNIGSFFNNAQTASDPTSAINAGNAFSNFSGQNALFGQQQGANLLGLAQQFGTNPTGVNEGIAQQAFNQGLASLSNTDFSQLAADQVARMRTLARPAEEQAVNAKFQNLFNRGTLSATSGDRALGELAQAQEMADIGRINVAEQFANNLAQQNRVFGQQMIGTGLAARGQDANFNAQMASTFGNLGQGLLGFGQGAGQSQFNTQFGLNELVNTRGQQRLQNAQGLLGFGSQLQGQNINETLGLFGGTRGINADLARLLSLSITGGDARAQAGARMGGFTMQGGISPIGAMLGGIGSGIVSQYGG